MKKQMQEINMEKMKLRNFSVKPCGFFIDKEAPYLGATPDGSCCGAVARGA